MGSGRRKPRKPRELLFAVAIALVVLAFLEAVFRIGDFGREPLEDFYDDIYDVSYGMVPGAVNPYSRIREQINRYGFRGEAYPEEKPPGTQRIVCLGDSCTFGFEVPAAEAYPARLERILAEREGLPPVEVINGGIPGTNLFQHLLALRSKLVRFDPDLVIVWSAPNWQLAIRLFRKRLEDPPFHSWFQRPLRKLAIYHWLLKKIRQGPTERAYFEHVQSGRPGDSIEGTRRPENRAYLEDYLEDLENLKDLSREHGFALAFTNYPSRRAVLNDDYSPPRYDMFHTISLDHFCRTHDYLMIDLVAPQRGVADEGYFLDPIHPGSEGYRVIAATIAGAILEAGLIPTGDETEPRNRPAPNEGNENW